MLDRYISQTAVTRTETRIQWSEVRSDLTSWAVDRLVGIRCLVATAIHGAWRLHRQIKRQARAVHLAVIAGVYAASVVYRGAVHQWQV